MENWIVQFTGIYWNPDSLSWIQRNDYLIIGRRSFPLSDVIARNCELFLVLF
jgi:hypothetical protein